MARTKTEASVEKLMDRAIRVEQTGYPGQLQGLELEALAAVAVCYEPPYNSYGKVKAYISEHGKLPPAAYRKPRNLWQPLPTPGALCRRCEHLVFDEQERKTCPMLMLRGAAGMHGSVIQCSEFKRKQYQKRKRSNRWDWD